MPDIIDNDLVLRLQKNDVKAFDALYWKYQKALYANIYRLIKEINATEDILQEVFITLWEKRLSIDPDKPVSNWLFVVSYNKSITYLKKVVREQFLFTDSEEPISWSNDTEINLTEDRFGLIEKALKQLSPQQRKVFDLCKLQCKSYQETAAELNISKHTVKEYLSLAMNNIQEYIKNHPDNYTVLINIALLRYFFSR